MPEKLVAGETRKKIIAKLPDFSKGVEATFFAPLAPKGETPLRGGWGGRGEAVTKLSSPVHEPAREDSG